MIDKIIDVLTYVAAAVFTVVAAICIILLYCIAYTAPVILILIAIKALFF